jgi:hypothetical protein
MMGNSLMIDENKPRSRFLKEFTSFVLQQKKIHGWPNTMHASMANDSKNRTERLNDSSTSRCDKSG